MILFTTKGYIIKESTLFYTRYANLTTNQWQKHLTDQCFSSSFSKVASKIALLKTQPTIFQKFLQLMKINTQHFLRKNRLYNFKKM